MTSSTLDNVVHVETEFRSHRIYAKGVASKEKFLLV
jgi:hypothetical protein